MKRVTEKLFESEIAGTAACYELAQCTIVTDTGPHRRFGVCVEMSGERAIFPDIFPTGQEARSFLATLCKAQVTPATLGDIVYDYICQ